MASTRRLAAIVFTDTVGYTAATQDNEAQSIDLLRRQEKLVRPLFAAYHGREIKSTGDGFLVEFESALEATQCAVDIQRRIYERNAQAGVAPFQIRIGIHLGDVEQHGTDILGDAVNIAARIEPVAEPGGVCVSGAVREQVWNKISDKLEKLPANALKGLQVPTDIYRVILPWTVREPTPVPSGPTRLAVLPFANISPDPKDEYFADGLTEEITTVLSQIPGLRVIARTSIIPYKTSPKPIAQIGAELRVTSVLEGSVRKSGNRLRITLQLIDVSSQEHTWSESYDRELDDVFAIQTAIARGVAESLKLRLVTPPSGTQPRTPSSSTEAYALYLKGLVSERLGTEDGLTQALALFREALAKDPWFASAHVAQAECLHLSEDRGYSVGKNALHRARESALAALRLEPKSAPALVEMASISIHECDWARAEKLVRDALEINPNLAYAHQMYCQTLRLTGRLKEASEQARQAQELDPLSTGPIVDGARTSLAAGRWDEAISYLRSAVGIAPQSASLRCELAVAYMRKDMVAEAIIEVDLARGMAGASLPPALADAAWVYTRVGRREEALRILDKLAGQAEGGGGWATVVAGIHAILGDAGSTFEWLDRANRESGGITPVHLERVWFETVRTDPRFGKVLAAKGLRPAGDT